MSLLLREQIQIVLDFTGGIFGIFILFFIPAAEVYKARKLIHREGNPQNYIPWLPIVVSILGLVFMGFNLYHIIINMEKWLVVIREWYLCLLTIFDAKEECYGFLRKLNLFKKYRSEYLIKYSINITCDIKQWVSPETPGIREDWQVAACPSIRRREPSKRPDPSPILNLLMTKPESEESESEEETTNSEPSVLRKEISTGPPKPSPEKLESSMLFTMHPTTNWSEPKPLSRTVSSPSMLLLSPLGIWTTTASTLVHSFLILGKKTKEGNVETAGKSQRAVKRIEERQKDRVLEAKVGDLFAQQRLYACISSRPGQSGRADGYILEGKELEFYAKKIESRRKWL